MSERNWTPEPWKLNKTNHGLHIISIAGEVTSEVPVKSGRTHNGYLFEVLPSRPFGEWHENGMRAVECVNACTGAPSSIQPGSVVALAEALTSARDLASQVAKKSGLTYSEAEGVLQEIDAALALYNGTGVE